ncbi:aspartic protein-like protein 1 [Dorcoceras hygrometricum]|uniref:Aspartic protein-like protein 1 n=1 Tax=Dorcoceras hygrometricum TaxID=472368 RepID=A0A2Z7DGH6_9LAMI|nr:aspartic protein-like protein 1 [Dorcoceras hygrometricum]
MHHRFSDHVKEWSRRIDSGYPAHKWPENGSKELYELLVSHDRVLHGRRLSGSDGALTFSDGNSTLRISSLGFLHYTTVTIGTPGMKFLVALDTGSDLFWVPCNCRTCASTDDSPYSSDFELSIYDPTWSTTSRNVTCSNDLCSNHASCSGTSNNCPYYVSYVSSETSTSGVLVQDILHLRTLENGEEFVKVYVTFGCGQVQTGSFLDIAAPNGLFGLGLEKISVPSILSREGYVSDSFSLCFGYDGTGRINFGDKGSLDQEETPFTVTTLHPIYNVFVTQVRVGTNYLDSKFTALFDSGTSFTYLVDPLYTMLSDSFNSYLTDKRLPPDPRLPFEYCYIMSPDTNTSLIPGMSLVMSGGGQLIVHDPIVVISSPHEFVYCLAIVKSKELNIIGQNFMTGYCIVFDREKLVLGWKQFDSVNTNSVPPASFPNHTTKSDDLKSSTARNLVASSLYKIITFDSIRALLIHVVIVVLYPI